MVWHGMSASLSGLEHIKRPRHLHRRGRRRSCRLDASLAIRSARDVKHGGGTRHRGRRRCHISYELHEAAERILHLHARHGATRRMSDE